MSEHAFELHPTVSDKERRKSLHWHICSMRQTLTAKLKLQTSPAQLTFLHDKRTIFR
jgi:hypothetical protein